MPLSFTHLVMSGGGFAALSYFGALRFLEVEGLLANIRNVSGTSMGAVFATAVALRIPLGEVEERLCAFMGNPEKNGIPFPNLLQSFQSLGVDDGRRLLDVLRPEIDQLTFLQLSKKTGMNLVICATHVPSLRPIYFSVDATPHVLVADALRASMAIPWVFKPVTIGDDLYVDGAVADNVPFKPFEDVPRRSVLVLHVAGIAAPLQSKDPIHYTIALASRFFSQEAIVPYLRILFPFYVHLEQSPLPFLSITLHSDMIRMKLTKEELDQAIAYGYETMFRILRPFMRLEP